MSNPSSRNFRGILFDFGGTLDSDGEHWLDRFYALYEEVGLRIPPEEIKHAFYLADRVCCEDEDLNSRGLRPLMAYHVDLQFGVLNLEDKSKHDQMVDSFCSKSERFLRRNALLLDSMKTRYRLGLVSNFYGNLAALCLEAGLSKSLEVICDSIAVGHSKPDTEIFLMALRGLDLPASRVTFVGDSYERDLIPAKGLGMKTIWLKGPNPRIPSEAPPVDACITSLTELDAMNP